MTIHDMSNAHLSTECEYLHPDSAVHKKMEFAVPNVKLTLQELLQGQLGDYAESNNEELDLADPNLNIKVFRRYPRSAAEIPCITINRTNQRGKVSGMGEVVEQNGVTEIRSFPSEERVEIQIYANNEDLRDALYTYVVETISAYKVELVRQGIQHIIQVDGNDTEVDDQHFTNSYLYLGTAIYEVWSEMQVKDTFLEAKAIHAFPDPILGGQGFGVEIERGGSQGG